MMPYADDMMQRDLGRQMKKVEDIVKDNK